jgi:hypothetical protein
LDPKQSREVRKTIMAKCQVRLIDDAVVVFSLVPF